MRDMADSNKVPLTPGSVINVPLGAKLEMQLKMPGSEGMTVAAPEESSRMVQQRMQSTMTSQSQRMAQVGESSVKESSQAVRKVMQDSRSMVSQSSVESDESQRTTKMTSQQKMQYSKQTYSSTKSSYESSE